MRRARFPRGLPGTGQKLGRGSHAAHDLCLLRRRVAQRPLKKQFEENHSLFLNLDDDKMLKVFRQVAGLPAPGEDMGGWYDLTGFSLERGDFHGFIAGHSFGQYVSGLARAYAVTGSEPTRAKINRLVKGYSETLDPKAKFFDDYRLPAYTYDKLSCGLIDAHEFAHDPMAMGIHKKLTHAIMAYLPEKALSRQNSVPARTRTHLYLGRDLHVARKSVSRLSADRRHVLSRHGQEIS